MFHAYADLWKQVGKSVLQELGPEGTKATYS